MEQQLPCTAEQLAKVEQLAADIGMCELVAALHNLVMCDDPTPPNAPTIGLWLRAVHAAMQE